MNRTTPQATPAGRPGFDRKMSAAEMNTLPKIQFEGPIQLITSPQEAETIATKLAGETLLGFDTETRPAFRKGEFYRPALLQLAAENEVYIFRLHETRLPAALKQLLSNPGIIKAGVAIHDDLKELQIIARFDAGGAVDLSTLSRKAGLHNHGLRGLSAVLLGRDVSKKEKLTNWARPDLTEAQLRYAATDAWLSRKLYLSLVERVPDSRTPPPSKRPNPTS